jgi:hypothetical protein
MAHGPSSGSEEEGWWAWVGRHRPELLLVALSITIAELLTGSTPVLALLDPLALLGLAGLYGAGVLLVREASLRWGKGWTGVLLLGAAYGVVEEGIATKTWVDPTTKAVGFLGTYGRVGGVSWDWAVSLTLFHAVFSIAVPILLVAVVYPETRDRSFLSDRGARYAIAAFAATVAVMFFGLDPHYFEGYAVLGLIAGIAVALVLLARLLPGDLLLPRSLRPTRSPGFFLGVGAAFSVGWLGFYLVLPHLTPWSEVPILAEVALAAATLLVLRRTFGREENRRHQLRFATGLLSWYVPWALVLCFAGDFLVLLPLAAVLALLFRTGRRIEDPQVNVAPREVEPIGPSTAT